MYFRDERSFNGIFVSCLGLAGNESIEAINCTEKGTLARIPYGGKMEEESMREFYRA